jgi:hypothetical protein
MDMMSAALHMISCDIADRIKDQLPSRRASTNDLGKLLWSRKDDLLNLLANDAKCITVKPRLEFIKHIKRGSDLLGAEAFFEEVHLMIFQRE